MISVFGLGYVGITTALYFCKRKNIKVYGLDIDNEKKDKIKKGDLPFLEKELDDLLSYEINKHFFVEDDINVINESKYIFICVNTFMNKDGLDDVSNIINVLNSILDNINTNEYRTIVIRSSIPPTTTTKKILPIFNKRNLKIGKDIGLCINPEFTREGCSYDEIVNSSRVILGTNDDKTKNKMIDLYYEDNIKIYNVNYQTAEFSKYLSNSFLGSLISFSNEMSIVADNIGDIDVKSSFDFIRNDDRWINNEMKNYVHPIGKYGGYCLVKDIPSLYNVSKENNYDSRFLKDTIYINDCLEDYFVNKIKKEVDKDKKIGILGLSFKPNSDDVRNTSSYYVIKKLCNNGYKNIYAYDPVAINNFKNTFNDLDDVIYTGTYKEILNKADVFIILTIWNEFKNIKDITDKKVIDFTHKI